MPPSRPEAPAPKPLRDATFSISALVKMSTPPLVLASIQAQGIRPW